MKRRLHLTREAWRRLSRKVDPNRSQNGLYRKALYSLSAARASWLCRIQHAKNSDAINSVIVSPPVFLLGFWRSGTTFLHELFCCDKRFGFPSTYACLNPSHFLLTEEWNRKYGKETLARRPMDDMRYSWTSPQEDEFALLALGAASPYEALIVPSLMRDPRLLLDLRQHPKEEQDRWKELLLYFLRLLAVQQGKSMILKSPPHGFKLSLLLTLFPDARYVVIERNPYEVFASNVKLWETLLDLYSVERFSGEEVEAFILSAFVVHEQAIVEGCRAADSRSIARVRFEDLVTNPMKEMERLYRELDISDFDTVRTHLERYLARVNNHQRNSYFLSAHQKRRVEEFWGDLIAEKDYRWSDGHLGLEEPAAV